MTNKRKKPPPPTLSGRRVPWIPIGAGVVALALIGAIAYSIVPRALDQAQAQRYAFGPDNPDPSTGIADVMEVNYPAGTHIQAPQRVAYDRTPAFGGAHDQYWATCTGVVYPDAIRTENAVHSLEHGAVWITYNPELVDADAVDTLAARVDGEPYTLMSPYPGLATAVSLQSWGHQLAVDDPADDRVGQFIAALRQNPNTYPEAGATCSTVPGGFDPANPPPFDPSPPGPDAAPALDPGAAADTAFVPAESTMGTGR